VVTPEYGKSNISALARYREGMILQEAGQLSTAVYAFRQAVELATNADLHRQALYRLGKAYAELQQDAEALAVLQRLMQDGQMVSATVAERLNLGLMLQHLAEYDLALQAFQQVASHFPQQGPWTLTALFRAGEIYEEQQYQKAMGMYQQVLTANPNDHQGHLAAERVKFLKVKLTKTTAPEG
jgi:tetratricopeptide (TPR) repeat protein